jgi:hypothetical protein
VTKQERIARHIDNIKKIFPHARDADPATLAASLRTLERQAHRSAERLCNDSSYSSERDDQVRENVLLGLDKLLRFREAKIAVRVNGDPRGYATGTSPAQRARCD